MLVTRDAKEFNLFHLLIQNMPTRVPYRRAHYKICALSQDCDKLPSGKQILALTLTYVLNLYVFFVGESFRQPSHGILILQLQGQIGR